MNTLEIVCNLPIEPRSLIFLFRPVNSIPGVPIGATTVPPLFYDVNYSQQTEDIDEYPLFERFGLIAGLPAGYSYSPNRFTKIGSVKFESGRVIPSNSTLSEKEQEEKKNTWIPVGTEKAPPKYDRPDTKNVPFRK